MPPAPVGAATDGLTGVLGKQRSLDDKDRWAGSGSDLNAIIALLVGGVGINQHERIGGRAVGGEKRRPVGGA